MPNNCRYGRKHKRGNCQSCKCCLLCKAPEGCQEKLKHRWRVPKRGCNRGGQQTVGLAKDRPSKRRQNDEDESQVWCQFIKKDRESKNVAKSSIALQAQQGGEDEIATIMPIPEANDQSNIEKKVDLASDYQLQKLVNSKAKELVQSTDYLVDAFTEQTATPFNPKQRISIIMAVIGIEKKEIANLLDGQILLTGTIDKEETVRGRGRGGPLRQRFHIVYDDGNDENMSLEEALRAIRIHETMENDEADQRGEEEAEAEVLENLVSRECTNICELHHEDLVDIGELITSDNGHDF